VGLRGSGAVSARKETGGAAAHFQRTVVLSRCGLRLLRRVSSDAELFRRDHPERRADDDRHGQLSGFRHVATVLLVWTGFVRMATLRKNRGFVLLGIFIFAAFVTPPDAVSQSAMAIPMYLLYEIGIIMAGLLLKEKIAARAKEEAEQSKAETGI
jgi:hypothetical protein